jgi:ADP-ribosylglycohydrolase
MIMAERSDETDERALAAYLGLPVGDVLGATVEFMTRRRLPPSTASTAGLLAVAGCTSRRGR